MASIGMSGTPRCLHWFKVVGYESCYFRESLGLILTSQIQVTVALEAFYMISTTTTKISILRFYHRLTSGTVSNRFLFAVYCAIGFVAAYFVVFFINLFIGCRPFDSFWQRWAFCSTTHYMRHTTPHHIPHGLYHTTVVLHVVLHKFMTSYIKYAISGLI
jgi:hypothetical protein